MKKYILSKSLQLLLGATVAVVMSGCIESRDVGNACIDKGVSDQNLSVCKTYCSGFVDQSFGTYGDELEICVSYYRSNYELQGKIPSVKYDLSNPDIRSLDTTTQTLVPTTSTKINIGKSATDVPHKAQGEGKWIEDGAEVWISNEITAISQKSLRAGAADPKQQTQEYKMKRSDFKYGNALNCPKTDTEFIVYQTINTYQGTTLTSKNYKFLDDNGAECTMKSAVSDKCTVHHASEGTIEMDVNDTIKSVVGVYAKVKQSYDPAPQFTGNSPLTVTIETGDIFICKP